MLATLDGPSYLERVAPTSPAGMAKTKKAIKHSFEKQIAGNGFSLVEILCTCPTHWRLSPVECLNWVDENMTPVFPPGVFVDK